ncbi:MAG: ATP-dependent Clp protease ATP-binding subunit [Anaerolineaceae bacterium]|nr:ATP-dependent Clp protease ATP-binding subunit [Anaerolineaceae bacterium]MCB9098573.1 ATP-dependent Clp protease ATP-binding subunit [Anaerolineales bacterium]
MTEKRGTLGKRFPSNQLTLALNKATLLMRAKRKQVMTAEMLLQAFLELPHTEAYQLLQTFSRERGFDWNSLVYDVERSASERQARDERFDFVTNNNLRVPLSDEILTVIDEGLTLAESQGKKQCNTAHALAIMSKIKVGTHWLLTKRGITYQAILETMASPSVVVDGLNFVDLVAKAKSGSLGPIYLRTDLLANLTNLLSMTVNRHLILLGPTGVGKRSLVLGLAKLLAQNQGPTGIKSVIQLNEQALVDDDYAVLQAGLAAAKAGVLFLPDIIRFFNGGSQLAFNELQKALLGNELAIIGTATDDQFAKLSKLNLVTDRTHPFKVPPATVAETTEILKTLRPAFEADYKIKITPESLTETARLAGRYYTVEPLPGAAVHLLHRACAQLKVDVEVDSGGQVAQDGQLDVDDVMHAASRLTGIPIANMQADERERYKNMADHLHKRIIGQDEAVQALSQAVKMARVGLKDPKRPIGSFMFLGPTGVGKTELAKALAEFMFGTENALITLDMSEYMEASSVNRLIGSPPGYVGYEAGGQLTDAVRERPYSVVLFDEIEKANVKVFDILLQVLDEGRLTDGKGTTVSFSECVILMTSNIGGRFLADPSLDEAIAREAAEEAVKEHFRPEFLNRLDDIIFFHLLTPENLRDIMDLLLKSEKRLVAERDLTLEISESAKTWLLEQNDQPEWGARPLRRIIQKHLREPLADFLLEENPSPGTILKVQKQKNGGLKFVQTKPKS